jgi:hypothetical protein
MPSGEVDEARGAEPLMLDPAMPTRASLVTLKRPASNRSVDGGTWGPLPCLRGGGEGCSCRGRGAGVSGVLAQQLGDGLVAHPALQGAQKAGHVAGRRGMSRGGPSGLAGRVGALLIPFSNVDGCAHV